MNLTIFHSLSDDTKRFVKSLADAYQHNIGEKLNIIMATQAELAALLRGVVEEQKKSVQEIADLQTASDALQQQVKDLQAVIAAGGDASQELTEAVAAVVSGAKEVDDKIPDAPTPVVVP